MFTLTAVTEGGTKSNVFTAATSNSRLTEKSNVGQRWATARATARAMGDSNGDGEGAG